MTPGRPDRAESGAPGARSGFLRFLGRDGRCLSAGRFAAWTAVAALVLGCSGDGPTGTVGSRVDSAEALRGRWKLQVPATTSCSSPLPEMELILNIEPFDVAGSPYEGVRDFVAGTWGLAGSEATDWLQGWLEFETGRVHLLLWQGVHVAGSVLDVRPITDRVLTGWLAEPIPPGAGGFAEPSEGYPGGFAAGECRWQVTARR